MALSSMPSMLPADAFPSYALHTSPVLPEAPCSVNGFFKVAGYDREFQATGRGLTALEAATNLHETIAATRHALAPAAPPTRTERLAALMAIRLEQIGAIEDLSARQKALERMTRVSALVLADAVQAGEMPGTYTVASLTSEAVYQVVGKTCTCKDYGKHASDEHTYCCKHVGALKLFRRLEMTA